MQEEAICYLTKSIKENNLKLLKHIAKIRNMNLIEEELFIEKYLKPSYYTPKIGTLQEEKMQYKIILKNINKTI